MGCFLIDLLLESFHRAFDNDRDFKEKYYKNIKYSSRFVLVLCLTVDFVYFYIKFPKKESAVRLFRLMRPCNYNLKIINNYFFYLVMMFYYDNELRRIIKSIFYSLKEIC